MKIEFDPAKDVANRTKHGLSLAKAERMELGTAVIDPDFRYAYGEERFQALGQIAGPWTDRRTPAPVGVHQARRRVAGNLVAQSQFEGG